MSKYLGSVVIMLLVTACSKTTYKNDSHGQNLVHGHGSSEIGNIRFTEFSDNFELFASVINYKKCKYDK